MLYTHVGVYDCVCVCVIAYEAAFACRKSRNHNRNSEKLKMEIELGIFWTNHYRCPLKYVYIYAGIYAFITVCAEYWLQDVF